MSTLPSFTWNLSPIVASGGGLTLRWFTLFWFSELALGCWALSRQVRRGGGDDEDVADLAAYVWLGLLCGARLGQGLFYDFERMIERPMWLFELATGGLSGHGGALGVVVAVWLFAKRRGMSALGVTDRLCFSAAITATIHRLANLFNSELVGKPTDGSWGIRFPLYDGAFGYEGALDGPLRHPSQLYEVAIGLCVLCVLLLCDRLWQREARPRGALTGVLLISYFSARFLIEFLKAPELGESPSWLNMGQLLSLPFIVAGLYVLAQSLRKRAKSAWLMPASP
jgi:phosphatidylglycerol---prolipoprotein diacylglyceryl transferase